ncbi:polysaccharide deacetylase family sporulation protein PdaB [Haloimpatiens sp. FM7315]|uniref:polysaccharide deacetylase family sporulation protein PdaB n=1 Tax=Haloimpatiens sp. FM7315 TaxID=3298609 RepID=UPI0035A2C8FF
MIKYRRFNNTIELMCILIVLLLVFFSFPETRSTFNVGERKLPIYNVDTKDKKIAITFDCGWDEDKTKEILEVLDKHNVKATFFLVGAWIDDFEKDTKLIYEKGHEIGNHSNMHPNMSRVSKERIIKEIEITDGKIMKITGALPKLFRCPSGDYNDLVVQVVEDSNHYCIQWDVDSIDWKGEGEEIEYNRVIKKTKPGSIILFHTNGKYTPKNLSKIIKKFQDEGYKFVKVSDLIYKEDFYIDSTGKQILK